MSVSLYQPVSSLPLLTWTYVAAAGKTRLVTGVTIELLIGPSGGLAGLIKTGWDSCDVRM